MNLLSLWGICVIALASLTSLESRASATNRLAGGENAEWLVLTQAMAPTEAIQKLQRLRKPALERISKPPEASGTRRRFEISREPGCITTNVIYTWRAPDGRQVWRREQTFYYPKTSQCFRCVQITNEEGGWVLYQRISILYPSAKTQKSPNSDVVFEKKVPLNLSEISGERVEEIGHVSLHFTEQCRESMRTNVDLRAKALKKEVPLLFRPFIPNSFFKMAAERLIPVRRETVIDEKNGDLIIFRAYAADGVAVWEQNPWQTCPDLPSDAYTVPHGVRQVRPKTANEANRLESQACEEERKSAK
jgi:hypothetical protein